MNKWKRRTVGVLSAVCLSIVILTACGDGIKEETSQIVTEKTNQALQIYADIEKIVETNSLQTDAAFVNMKQQLMDMSTKVKTSIKDTTEEDGQQAVKELDEVIKNLQSVKMKVEDSVAEAGK